MLGYCYPASSQTPNTYTSVYLKTAGCINIDMGVDWCPFLCVNLAMNWLTLAAMAPFPPWPQQHNVMHVEIINLQQHNFGAKTKPCPKVHKVYWLPFLDSFCQFILETESEPTDSWKKKLSFRNTVKREVELPDSHIHVHKEFELNWIEFELWDNQIILINL